MPFGAGIQHFGIAYGNGSAAAFTHGFEHQEIAQLLQSPWSRRRRSLLTNGDYTSKCISFNIRQCAVAPDLAILDPEGRPMQYLCLAYGAESDWNGLTKEEQDGLLAQDEVLRTRGVLMGAVKTTVTTVRAWDGKPTTTNGAFAEPQLPLAGFSVIEASDLNEVIRLVAGTPCARAKGAIEIRPIIAINDFELIR